MNAEITVFSWPVWLALGSLIAVGLVLWRRPIRKSRPKGHKDVPMWSKKGFQISGIVILLIFAGLVFV